MKHAIIILIHQLPNQVNHYLDQLLKSTDMDIYIHINTKCDHIRPLIMRHERIFISENCVPITWGDDGVFLAMCQMFREVIASGKEYGHVCIGTGQDMLIRKGIDDFLSNHLDRVYVSAKRPSDKSRRVFLLNRYPAMFIQLLDKKYDPRRIARFLYMTFIAKTGIRLFPRNVDFDVSSITFYYSFLWASLPFEVVKYIIDRFDADPNLFNLYKGSFVAEESFLATLVMDSKYREWLHWEENGVSSSLTCTVGEADNHPLVIKMKDIKKVEDSGLFFARKFDERVDKEVIEYFYNKTTKG